MRTALLAALLLVAACSGKPSDRLTDAEAAAEQVAPDNEQAEPVEEAAAPVAPAAPLPEPGKAGPLVYRAVGTEPGWTLVVRPGRTDYIGDYGEVRIAEPTPPDFRPGPGSWTSGRLQLTISAGPCNDGMSDLTYRDSVLVVADGRSVSGCGGGTVGPASLAGSRWTVAAINGRSTGGGASYFINFGAGQLDARFGCNQIGGPYREEDDRLTAGPLEQTLIGCPEAAGEFEELGRAILARPMRIERLSGTRLRLSGDDGTIELRRSI